MSITDFLTQANVLTDVPAKDKEALLHELASRASGALNLQTEVVLNELQKREELGSTGMGGGIAIPHARLHAIKLPFGILARLKKPIEFDAVDSQPVDIVFLLLLPVSTQSELHALAAVSRKLRNPDVLARMRAATSAVALYKAICDDVE
jgi:PTS system nitrogen regulatory IIA component